MNSISRNTNQTTNLSNAERKELNRRSAALSDINRMADDAINISHEAGRQARNNIHRLANSPVRETTQSSSSGSGPNYWPIFWGVAVIAVAVFAIVNFLGKKITNSNDYSNPAANSGYIQLQSPTSNQTPQAQSQTLQTEENEVFHDGFIFPESHSRYLSQEEIDALHDSGEFTRARQIQYAINEIYAYNGFHFNKPEFADFYNACGWYTDMGYDSNDETMEDLLFEPWEKANLKLLIEARKASGN